MSTIKNRDVLMLASLHLHSYPMDLINNLKQLISWSVCRKVIPHFLFSILIILGSCSAYGQTPETVADSLYKRNIFLNEETLDSFYVRLHRTRTGGGTVRILHLGDSHIQMGYFVQEMRSVLSTRFSGAGPGAVFPYPLAMSRPFYVKATSTGIWKGSNYLRDQGEFLYGLSGFTVKTTSPDASLDLRTANYQEGFGTGNRLVLYFNGPADMELMVEGKNLKADSVRGIKARLTSSGYANDSVWRRHIYEFDSPVDQLSVRVRKASLISPFFLYGAELTQGTVSGVVYSNCGVGGSQLKHLTQNASLAVSQIGDTKPDLVILSYGSNDSYFPSFRAETYYMQLAGFVDSLRSVLPGVPIVLTSPPDTRAKNRFPRNLDSIVYVMKKVSNEKKVAFWNLYQEMGGSGSVFKWVRTGLGSTDQLHFSREGYATQARMFSQALFRRYNLLVPTIDKIPDEAMFVDPSKCKR